MEYKTSVLTKHSKKRDSLLKRKENTAQYGVYLYSEHPTTF